MLLLTVTAVVSGFTPDRADSRRST